MKRTLYRARWVLPVSAPAISNGSVLVDEGGTIAAVGPRDAVDAGPDTIVLDLGETVVLPGLVNVHAHPELAMFRGALEDLPFRDWILRLVGAKRSVLRDEDYDAAARWTAVEAIRSGITTIGATEASGAAVRALSEAGLRGIVYQEAFGPDPARADAAMDELRAALDRLAPDASDRVRIGISPHAPYTVSDELYRATAALARAESLPMAVHIAESSAERRLVAEGNGDFAHGLKARGIDTRARARSPIDLLRRLGVLELAPLLIHCVNVDDEDIAAIASAGATVAHCPVANAKLGHGTAPLPALHAAGIAVGLGTDSVGSNNRLDLLEEARIASLLHRAAHQSREILPADALLRMATIDGARALGIEDRVGTLEPGKAADLCGISLGGPHTRPVHDPTTAIFHAARGSDVVLTLVDGRVLFRNGQVLTVDTAEVGARVDEAAARLREAL
jgi:cytosine/adenosine deaminase-related metal-dependent hydrolase